MIKKSLLTIALLSSLTLQAEDTTTKQVIDTTPVQQSTNNGLLGATYLKAYVGTTKFGDDETADILDSNIQYGIKGQFKINDNLSLAGGVEMLTADIDYSGITGDASGTALYLEGLYHFLPNDTIDPFISLGLAYVSYDTDMTYQGQTFSDSESDNGYQFAAGAEFDLTNKIFLTPAFSYSKIGDGDASKDVSVEIDFEVATNFYLGGKINVELEDTDTSYYVGLGFKF
jgi:opacity protein-like surface antigen